jgi:3-phenylpropionate/trans-cinnamate dioxygenase ferredoxin subunit
MPAGSTGSDAPGNAGIKALAKSKHVVAAVRDLPPGSRKLVRIDGRDIVVFNVKGEYFGVLNRCPHNGGDLSKGTLGGVIESPEPGVYRLERAGELIRCPWHGWQFDLRTGQSWCEPGRIKTIAYPVEVADGEELVRGPYVAETVAVSVDEDYVVIEA